MSQSKSAATPVANYRERLTSIGWDKTRSENAARNFDRTIRHFMVMMKIFCCVLTVFVLAMIVYELATKKANRSTLESELIRHGRCWLVDLLPNDDKERDSPPWSGGRFCIDDVQLLVYWEIKGSLSSDFKLTDFLLRGPLGKHTHRAPAVLTLGLRDSSSNGHHRKRHQHRLSGSISIQRTLVAAIFENPTHYYLSLEGVELEADHDVPHEIARDKLWRPIKI